MANIVLFHSIMGLRSGVTQAAGRLTEKGHKVFAPDLMNGETFENMDAANKRFQEIGAPEIMTRAAAAIRDFPSDTFYAGFSFGGVCALRFAASKPGALGCISMHAAVPPAALGLKEWPKTVPVQIHFADRDVWKNREHIELLAKSVRESGAFFEYCAYPLDGHLFTDPDLPEFNPEAAEQLWLKVENFLKRA